MFEEERTGHVEPVADFGDRVLRALRDDVGLAVVPDNACGLVLGPRAVQREGVPGARGV